MSSTPSPVTPTDGTENPYIVVVNKRIRAYKKKIERINSLRGKENLNKEQMELCSHFDLYSTILTELLGIKEQLAAIQPSYSESPVDIPIETTPLDDCSMENPINEEVEKVEEVEEVEKIEEKPEEVVPEKVEETEVVPEVVEEVTEKPVEKVEVEEKKEEEKKEEKEEKKEEKEEKKGGRPRKFYHGRKEGGKRDENRPHNSRRERNNYRRNGRQHAGRVTEDGWEIPKKVAYIKQDKL